METAITLLLDGSPLIGEQVVVSGQGIVGLLTTALLARFPLTALITLDCHALRRQASLRLGASNSLDPTDPQVGERLGVRVGGGGEADLVYELSGVPAALDRAIALSRYSGRVVVGSWYGAQKVQLDLGSFFHRGRVSLISSQVSTMAPSLSGRWQGWRRIQVAWEMLRATRPSHLITQRIPLADAAAAYDLIHRAPQETIQVILEHGGARGGAG
jgi:threonine dehydrogenase-like Zn-dependent dehydrogenase